MLVLLVGIEQGMVPVEVGRHYLNYMVEEHP